MRILLFRYGSIYEPMVISALSSFGLEIVEERSVMDDHSTGVEVYVKGIFEKVTCANEAGKPFLFVFSINYVASLSEACEKLGVYYVCWSVDCPVLELFSKTIKNSHTFIFLFDRAQYERFHKYNPKRIFYLPLATDVDKWDRIIATTIDEERKKFSSDISLIGSLYSEKNPLNRMKNLDDYTKGYIDAICAAQLKVYGYNFIEEVLTDEIVSAIKGSEIVTETDDLVEPIDRYAAAHFYIGMKLAEDERRELLNMLAERFDVDLYTQSDVTPVPKVHMRGAANSTFEMPKIFNLSKINLNITMRPIQTGMSLRIFDVMGCGGFLLTNYQTEIPEYFEIGRDLEVFTSPEDLMEKCEYYLTHEEERQAIAKSGYEKVKAYHNINVRMKEMLGIVTSHL